MNAHEKQLKDLMQTAGVVIQLTATPHIERDGWDAAHYAYAMTNSKCSNTALTGTYSMGWGHFKKADLPQFSQYGKGHALRDRTEAFNLLTKGRKDSDVVKAIKQVANEKRLPDPVNVFWSLLQDSQDSDRDFESWAGDLGYSEDSIKAKTIWKECNKIRRALESTINRETLNDMFNVASEI